MNLRRTLVSAALVAAVISPAAMLSAVPAFAESVSTAQTQNDTASIAALEKAQADASAAVDAARMRAVSGRANFETFKANPQPYLMWVQRAKEAAEKTAGVAAAANKEAEAAALAFGSAKPEELDKARERMQAASKAANEAIDADRKAKEAVTVAEKKLNDVLAAENAKVVEAEEAVPVAIKAYQAANKAYADAKAVEYARQEAEQRNDKPTDKPTDKPAEQPATVAQAADTTASTASTSSTKPTAKATAASSQAKSTTAATAKATTGSTTELAETGSNPATPYLALGSGLALSLGAAALYVSRRKPARSSS
ncbi:LAETG motif-containing sortase-dependent surface protein [Kitasatospora sp. NPDC059817]|uniref:LAETG motif-containing sortase-dependent surface protein n=1 Tax=Kitasatospora sp. NPDC059817 TaxID=3346961 RepID=UPI00365D1C52